MFDVVKKVWSVKKKSFGKMVYNIDLEFFGPARVFTTTTLEKGNIIEWERDKRKPQNLVVYKMGTPS